MSAVPAPAPATANDPWTSFAELLDDEVRKLHTLSASARALTDALVKREPATIVACDDRLERDRKIHEYAHLRRVAMQKRGFGKMPLRTVITYAPSPINRTLYNAVAQIAYSTTALSITVTNNRALIGVGLDRLGKTIRVLQRANTEQTGTYKRRGIVKPSAGHVVISSHV
jgi:hypothetical protein